MRKLLIFIVGFFLVMSLALLSILLFSKGEKSPITILDRGKDSVDIEVSTSSGVKPETITFSVISEYEGTKVGIRNEKALKEYLEKKGILQRLISTGALDLKTDLVSKPKEIRMVVTPEKEFIFGQYATDGKGNKVQMNGFGGGFIPEGVYELKVYINKQILEPENAERLVTTNLLQGLYLISSSGSVASDISDEFEKIEQDISKENLRLFSVNSKTSLNFLVKEVYAQTCTGQDRGCYTQSKVLSCIGATGGSCVGKSSGDFCYSSGGTPVDKCDPNTDPYCEVGKCSYIDECSGFLARSCEVQATGVCQADPCNPTYNCNPALCPPDADTSDPCQILPNCYWTSSSTPTPGGTPTPPPTPSCTVDLTPATASIPLGNDLGYIASVTIGSGTVDQVNFTSSDTGIATVSPASDTTSAYTTTASSVSVGTATITADVVMSGAVRCSDTASLDVTTPGPWWQTIDSDIITNGDLLSLIPASCALPGCNPLLGLEGLGGYPGVPSYGGTATYGSGSVSSPGWEANSQTNFSKIYDYAFFERLVRPDVTLTEIDSPTVNGGYFVSGGAPTRGYVWYHFDGTTLGDLTINSNINMPGDRKVVVLVDNADLYINGRINIVDGSGFFMAIVGKNDAGVKGNIYVDPSVAHSSQIELEGVFFSEGQFHTGAGNEQLHVRGMVAAYDGVVLERDLTDNSTESAEVFEYAPEMVLTFPRDLTFKRIRWKEVAP